MSTMMGPMATAARRIRELSCKCVGAIIAAEIFL